MSLSTPAQVQTRLEEIDGQLALAANGMEEAAFAWFRKRAEREVAKAEAYAKADGPATERKIKAEAAAAVVGVDEEARWEARKLVSRLLESRANVGMAILKAQGRS